MGHWIFLQDPLVIYLTLFALLLGGAVGLPIPEDLPLILAGAIIHTGKIGPVAIGIVCYLGIVLGDMVVYSIGRYFGPKLFTTRFLKNRITPERAERMHQRLMKHSIWMIFVARHLFYLRTVTFLTCGAFKMSFIRFMFIDALAALISTPIMMGVGYVMVEHLPTLFESISKLKSWVLFISLILFLIAGYIYKRRRHIHR